MKGDAWSDEQLLMMLHLREVEGVTAQAVGERLGASRSAVLGICRRINLEADKHADLAQRPQNRDGGMPAQWWRRPARASRRRA